MQLYLTLIHTILSVEIGINNLVKCRIFKVTSVIAKEHRISNKHTLTYLVNIKKKYYKRAVLLARALINVSYLSN